MSHRAHEFSAAEAEAARQHAPVVPLQRDFFLSYTGSDRAWAEWVAWTLEGAGYRVLIQAWDFVPGSNWTLGMQQGVEGSVRTIALLSRSYLRSVFGQAEWQAAMAQDPSGFQRKLVPIRIEDCERPGLLGQIVSFDLFNLTESAAKQLLLTQLAHAANGRSKPNTAPAYPGIGHAVSTGTKGPTVIWTGNNLWEEAERQLTGAWGRPVTAAEVASFWRTLVDANRPVTLVGTPPR